MSFVRLAVSGRSNLFVCKGVPDHIRSDNGSEFTAKSVREWLGRVGVKTLFIEPGSPWENGYIESFNGKLRDELLVREAFVTLLESNGAIRTVAAAHQHDPATQCLGLSAKAPPGVAGLIGGQNPNLRTGVIHAGSSKDGRKDMHEPFQALSRRVAREECEQLSKSPYLPIQNRMTKVAYE